MTDMTEPEARGIVYAVGTAMLNEDKEAREIAYADLDGDEMRKIFRWAMRQNLYNFAVICQFEGIDIKEAWSSLAMINALGEE